MCKGSFKRALQRDNDVHILLNHDWNRDLGSIEQGNLILEEDNIGLHAQATIKDKYVAEAARNGDLVGWSYGFEPLGDEYEKPVSYENGMPVVAVRDINLYEVSILDRHKTPAYEGTLICARDDGSNYQFVGADFVDDIEYRDMSNNATDDSTSKNNDVKSQENTEEKTDTVENQHVDAEKNKVDYSKIDAMIKEIKEDIESCIKKQ